MSATPNPADHPIFEPHGDETWSMEILGYERYYRQGSPSEEDAAAVEKTFEQQKKYCDLPTLHCLGGDECEAFLRSQAPEIEGMISRSLRVEFRNLTPQRPKIFQSVGGQSSPKMAHPSGADGVSVFAVVRGSGSITIYPDPSVGKYAPKLENSELFIVPGLARIEIPPNGEVLMLEPVKELATLGPVPDIILIGNAMAAKTVGAQSVVSGTAMGLLCDGTISLQLVMSSSEVSIIKEATEQNI
ncbi:hypothetical protein MW887_008621 [Aspergillus wentii]|nr:hypothetical protein MW887_008621 [Aspergillus wentii]